MNPEQWNRRLLELPDPHILQTWQWGSFKQETGWQAEHWLLDGRSESKASAACLILQRSARLGGLPLRLRVQYAPRGPLVDWSNDLLRHQTLDALQEHTRKSGAIFLKIDPQVPLGFGPPDSALECDNPVGLSLRTELQARGWRFSTEQIQFRNTVIIDLRPDEEQLLAGMKQKTRYNIRLAERKGVQVRTAREDELAALYRIYAETSVRDGFVIRPQGYYLQLWRTFLAAGMLEPLLAEVDGEPVAGLMLFHFGSTAWYLHGMSSQAHREKMPTALLQWHAMRRAKSLGCHDYDLWGAPENFNETDGMWGVYRFKEGLGGRVLRGLGAWDFPVRKQLYILYTRLLPEVLAVLRRRGQAQTRQEVGA